MARQRSSAALPALYAHVHPGLEEIAGEEVTRDLGGSVRKSERGLLVFRTDRIDPDLLRLRTTEDVFLLAWGTDQLTFRALDLKNITQWTRTGPDWEHLLRLHHAVRPAHKGRPTVRIIVQMAGKHVYYRSNAGEAVYKGLIGKIPPTWPMVEDNASLEIWLSIAGKQAVCGIRLSDRTMRHRGYKREHLPASLRPTVAAAMTRLVGAAPGMRVLDPMCGAGTILAEQVDLARARRAGIIPVIGGDLSPAALKAAAVNLRSFGPEFLARWDARALPLAPASVERIVCNPPFGVQLGDPNEIGPLYRDAVREWDRVLTPEGRAVIIVSEPAELVSAARSVGWRLQRQVRVSVLGLRTLISVWQKPAGSGTIAEAVPVVDEPIEDTAADEWSVPTDE
jgi:23S rRNA G2445 N2-methylase RlmL